MVEHNLRFDSPIPYIPGGLTNLTSPTAANACADETADTCILDINQGTLNIIDFQPRFEGSYRFRIPYGFENDEVCFVNFNLHEASKLLIQSCMNLVFQVTQLDTLNFHVHIVHVTLLPLIRTANCMRIMLIYHLGLVYQNN